MPVMLSFKELAAHGIPYSRQHIDTLEKAGQFPKRIHIGKRTVRWIASEVDAVRDRAIANRK
jgi:predicted DNA-binding transcriptional regulator AlpA